MPVSSELWLHGLRRRSWTRFLLEPGGASRSPESPWSFQPVASGATFPANNVNSPSCTHVSAGSAGAWPCRGAGGKCAQGCRSSRKPPPGQPDSRVWAGRAADPGSGDGRGVHMWSIARSRPSAAQGAQVACVSLSVSFLSGPLSSPLQAAVAHKQGSGEGGHAALLRSGA